ncbi:hypothetical protein BDY24DRAFT_330147, partial [Mrakia frigida]|uniref:uncharacterized protein n=1 Tax=Mrakia frigida TaxID=29902 RepID=UPI003FCC26AA
FTPKYPQPFTLAEALDLDPSVITEEISRLQNSLTNLRSSNVALLQYLHDEGEDRDLRESVHENELTIASQEERIDMLRVAL